MVGEQLGDVCVEDEAVAGHDGGLDAIVDAARCCFPCQPSSVAVQLQSASTNRSTTHVRFKGSVLCVSCFILYTEVCLLDA